MCSEIIQLFFFINVLLCTKQLCSGGRERHRPSAAGYSTDPSAGVRCVNCRPFSLVRSRHRRVGRRVGGGSDSVGVGVAPVVFMRLNSQVETFFYYYSFICYASRRSCGLFSD